MWRDAGVRGRASACAAVSSPSSSRPFLLWEATALSTSGLPFSVVHGRPAGLVASCTSGREASVVVCSACPQCAASTWNSASDCPSGTLICSACAGGHTMLVVGNDAESCARLRCVRLRYGTGCGQGAQHSQALQRGRRAATSGEHAPGTPQLKTFIELTRHSQFSTD